MMLLKAKNRMAIATYRLPPLPISLSKAIWVSCTPLASPPRGTPLKIMMKAVQVQMTNVSENTPNV